MQPTYAMRLKRKDIFVLQYPFIHLISEALQEITTLDQFRMTAPDISMEMLLSFCVVFLLAASFALFFTSSQDHTQNLATEDRDTFL